METIVEDKKSAYDVTLRGNSGNVYRALFFPDLPECIKVGSTIGLETLANAGIDDVKRLKQYLGTKKPVGDREFLNLIENGLKFKQEMDAYNDTQFEVVDVLEYETIGE